MSKIASYARAESRNCTSEIRGIAEGALAWLDRYERDPQCDDEDRETIERERAHLRRILAALR